MHARSYSTGPPAGVLEVEPDELILHADDIPLMSAAMQGAHLTAIDPLELRHQQRELAPKGRRNGGVLHALRQLSDLRDHIAQVEQLAVVGDERAVQRAERGS